MRFIEDNEVQDFLRAGQFKCLLSTQALKACSTRGFQSRWRGLKPRLSKTKSRRHRRLCRDD
jgi:hypothetical protein